MPAQVDNSLYESLGERWYEAQDDPVALLRAERRATNPWVEARIARFLPDRRCRVLDIACGGGFLSNYLADRGHDVTGIDLSTGSLSVARSRDESRSVAYVAADGARLPFADHRFDVVAAMDFLEHIEEPGRIVAEAARLLRPGGLFFFHTFNRNLLSWLVVIKGVEWFVRNTPPRMHVLRLFLTPSEVAAMCAQGGLHVREIVGSRPDVARPAFWKMLATRRVPEDFSFLLTRSTAMGYLGYAEKV